MESLCTRLLQSPSCRVGPLDRPRSIGWRWRDRACANATHPLPLWVRNRRGQIHRQHQFRQDALIGSPMGHLVLARMMDIGANQFLACRIVDYVGAILPGERETAFGAFP